MNEALLLIALTVFFGGILISGIIITREPHKKKKA